MSIFKEAMSLVDTLDLRIEKIRATRDMFPFMDHVICRIATPKGQEITGRGLAFDEKTAFERAIGEALERYFYIESGKYPNTNGIALHTSVELAKKSALHELIERDSYLCHFYTRTPFFRYQLSELSDSIFPEASRILKHNNFELMVARLSSLHNFYISLAVCFGKLEASDYGFSLGLSCQATRGSSINASIMEAISLVPSFLEGLRPRTLTKEEFFKKEKVDVFDIAALAHNISNFRDLEPLFSLQDCFKPSNFSPAVEFYEIEAPEALISSNLRAIKAKSDQCQELFFDKNIMENLNLHRLAQFTGDRLDASDIPMIPHYFA